MKLLNYTTTVDAAKTVSEIQAILVAHGAKAITMEYDGGSPVGLQFFVNLAGKEVPFQLPCNWTAVRTILSRTTRIHDLDAQAKRVAWRILKTWVAAQMALIETHMVTLEQVFLPYYVTPSGQTLYETTLPKMLPAPEKPLTEATK